ncbi:MAG TPA: hypothetical protein VIK25_10825 [Gemmatimonadaceae bacterium]
MLVLGTMLAMVGAAAAASAQNKMGSEYGEWELDVGHSTYRPGPAPKSSWRRYVYIENGYTFLSRGVDAQGKHVSTNFTVHFDGKYAPMTGSSDADSIMVRRVDDRTVESTQKKGGKVVIHTQRVTSRDGTSMTSTSWGTNAAGKEYKNVEVFGRKK